ncbi:hypothetical protein BDV98DRAFT_567730 [Pterulicium gracile]|uniref:C2H2-type domain-containing protein n=1 Tax=Pterulicium gracile TaxID=1884261 RepID=A0A5C3QL67_9AGAR|nr:hypothetical protein BDV98DRAFT_567730 [Pterula gracilis]
MTAPGRNDVNCEICGVLLKGADTYNVWRHVLFTHFPEMVERCECPWCFMSISRKDALKRHIEEQHFGKKRGESWDLRGPVDVAD